MRPIDLRFSAITLVRHLEGSGIQTAVIYLSDTPDKNLGVFPKIIFIRNFRTETTRLITLHADTVSVLMKKTLIKNLTWQDFLLETLIWQN
jgi:hypothetical protein